MFYQAMKCLVQRYCKNFEKLLLWSAWFKDIVNFEKLMGKNKQLSSNQAQPILNSVIDTLWTTELQRNNATGQNIKQQQPRHDTSIHFHRCYSHRRSCVSMNTELVCSAWTLQHAMRLWDARLAGFYDVSLKTGAPSPRCHSAAFCHTVCSECLQAP